MTFVSPPFESQPRTPVNSFRRRISALYIFVVIASAGTCLGANAASDAPFLGGGPTRILILGDSITQDGRYVSYLEYYLHRLAPGQKIDIISIGLSSETASGLSEKSHPFPRPCVLERLDRALKMTKPQVVLACYGMNDGIYHPPSDERLAAFNQGIRHLIVQVRATGASLMLITPPVFDASSIRSRSVPKTNPEFGYSNPYDGYDEVLAEYAHAEQAIHETAVTVSDVHGAFLSALAAQRRNDPNFTFAPDGVHPNDEGHRLIARTLLQSMGYTLPADSVAEIQADPVFSLIHQKRQLRSESWLPFVGYVREAPFKSASVTAAEAVIVRLQHEIDAIPVK